jgi:hypothetical protein
VVEILLYAALIVGGVFVVAAMTHAVWRAKGAYRIRQAGARPLRASRHRLWRDPGSVERLDLRGGPGGSHDAPKPPFIFLEKHATGSQPTLSVRDAAGRKWRVKWGNEVHSETFAVRMAWACGYFAEVTHFVPAGSISGTAGLAQLQEGVNPVDGTFTNARFELDDPEVNKLFEEHSWSWDDNPFVGTRELNGLKILVMLLSNWDTKDRRDVARGSNTAIFEVKPRIVPPRALEARYLVTDWGGSMGKWGANIVSRGRWDCQGYEGQTQEFVRGVERGLVMFGYAGQHTADIAHDISVDHARWFCAIVSRLSERQIIDALAASGASDEEQRCFARAIMARINQLRTAVGL